MQRLVRAQPHFAQPDGIDIGQAPFVVAIQIKRDYLARVGGIGNDTGEGVCMWRDAER